MTRGPEREYPWIDIAADDWLRVSAQPASLVRAEVHLFTSALVADRLRTARVQHLEQLIKLLRAAAHVSALRDDKKVA